MALKGSKRRREPTELEQYKGLLLYARKVAEALQIEDDEALLLLILYELKCLHSHKDMEMKEEKHHVDGEGKK